MNHAIITTCMTIIFKWLIGTLAKAPSAALFSLIINTLNDKLEIRIITVDVSDVSLCLNNHRIWNLDYQITQNKQCPLNFIHPNRDY